MILYVIRHMTALDGPVLTHPNGPFDYARSAIDERNVFWKYEPAAVRCWIEQTRDGKTIGRYGALFQREPAR